MGILENIRTKYPVETAVAANALYGVYLWTQGDMTPKQLIGYILQVVIFAGLGMKQRQNSAISTGQNEAIIQNQVATVAADPHVDKAVAKDLMAPRSAAHLESVEPILEAKRMSGETKIGP
jgi:hypothetical protein